MSPPIQRIVLLGFAVVVIGFTANIMLLQPSPQALRERQQSAQTASQMFVLLDEHPDSINAGGYANQMVEGPATARIIDYPASYHNRAAGISFADGHAEIRKWVDPRTVQPVKFYDMPLNVASPNNADVIWLAERTSVKN